MTRTNVVEGLDEDEDEDESEDDDYVGGNSDNDDSGSSANGSDNDDDEGEKEKAPKKVNTIIIFDNTKSYNGIIKFFILLFVEKEIKVKHVAGKVNCL